MQLAVLPSVQITAGIWTCGNDAVKRTTELWNYYFIYEGNDYRHTALIKLFTSKKYFLLEEVYQERHCKHERACLQPYVIKYDAII